MRCNKAVNNGGGVVVDVETEPRRNLIATNNQ
jgi:hypothetical protein